MKIDWNQPVLNFNDEEIRLIDKDKKDKDGNEERRPVLVGEECVNALLQDNPHDKPDPKRRFEKSALARRIHDLTGEALVRRTLAGHKPDDEFTADEIAQVIEAVKTFGNRVMMHFVVEFLDGKRKPPPKPDAPAPDPA